MSDSSVQIRSGATTKLWFIAISICAGTAFPTFLGLYFPNNARPVIQQFFKTSIYDFAEVQKGSETIQNLDINNFTDLTNSGDDSAGINHVWSAYTALGTIAMVLGKLTTPLFDNRFGRRKTLIICSCLDVLTHILECIAQPVGAWPLSFIGRFCSLFFAGITTDMAPVFLNEIAPPVIRGSLGILYPMGLCLGTAVGAGLGLEAVLGTEILWPFAFLVPVTFFALIIPLFLWVPETPQAIGRQQGLELGRTEMERSLLFYHGHLDHWDSVVDKSMQASSQERSVCGSFRLFWYIVSTGPLRPSFLITLVLACSYCFSGLPLLNFYSFTILERANVVSPSYFSFGLQLLSFFMFLVCFFLIDRAGRRPLLLISCAGTAMCWPLIVCTELIPNVSWKPILVLSFIVLAQTFINLGIRPLFFPVVPELFPVETRAAGQALGGLLTGTIQVPIIYAVPPLLSYAGSYTYIMLAIPLALCTVFLYMKFPETQGCSTDEILKNLKPDDYSTNWAEKSNGFQFSKQEGGVKLKCVLRKVHSIGA